MTSARLAVDIGGTFTDLALEREGARFTAKTLTTPAAPEQGVLTGIAHILRDAGLAPGDVALVVHGTTLATNAIIERKGAPTALITTEGFRDVLAMGNESRYDQYDLQIRLPEPLVPRHLRLPVPERIDAEGRVLLPLDEDAVRALIPTLRAEGVQSVAVGFLHAFTNPAHEQRAGAILEAAGFPVTLSSDVSPEMREWERFSTAAANAYVQPLMQGYLRRLERELHAMGLNAPVFLMLSGGGLTTVDTACRFPIRLVESGPAGGAIFSAAVARAAGLDRVLSFDMGGTTAKICLIDDGQPQTSRSFEVARIGRFKKGSGLPLRIPVIEMVEIGAGGGSLAHLDALGRIAVGPESAGAMPGPACYGRGGTQPAVTDANLVLGRYDPARFAGGTMALDSSAAEAALDRRSRARVGRRQRGCGGRRDRDGGRDHGQCRPHPRHRERQDLRGPHRDRIRRRWPGACVPGRGKDRRQPHHRAAWRRGGQRHRLPARARRLRGGAEPVWPPGPLRQRGGRRPAGGNGAGRGRRGRARPFRRADPHRADRVHAVCRPGA